VLTELEERRAKENNIVIHGIQELNSQIGTERKDHDTKEALNILKGCKMKEEKRKIVRVARLGRYDKDNTKRPLLVAFENIECKKELFRNIKNLQEDETFKDIRIKNDLTRTEREQEAKLREETKELNEQAQWKGDDVRFRLRGPPWDRKIVKEKPLRK
jgi:hypothetical protein